MKVTVGLPFYNCEQTLAYAIESVLSQTYELWELILINDGSTDNSVTIAKSYSDPRIILLDDKLNKGLASRLNEITALASGDMIARMDADDIMDPRRLEKQLIYLEMRPEVDLVGSSAYIIDLQNNVTGLRSAKQPARKLIDIVRRGMFIHPSVMGRRSWFLENSYNTALKRSEDFDMWVRTYKKSTFHNIEEPLLYYRETGIAQYKKYIKTQTEKLALLKDYATKYISPREAIYFSFLISGKMLTYSLANFLGLESNLTSKRNQSFTEEQKKQATDRLKSEFRNKII
ncbi:glycosyltransferase family 2 protein [Deinococcus sonorensis]|uniref:Glycosyltransferase family 2 protein n=1 Tax=Deinococcus sonorensis TaxID=309891 RepID=A0ABV8YAY3_9DEIO